MKLHSATGEGNTVTVDDLPPFPQERTAAQDPEAAAAWASQSAMTCDHGRLLWHACRPCNVGPLDVHTVDPTSLAWTPA